MAKDNHVSIEKGAMRAPGNTGPVVFKSQIHRFKGNGMVPSHPNQASRTTTREPKTSKTARD